MIDTFQRHTERALRDLHARELMRLGWYRQWQGQGHPDIQELRERKAQHQAFLNDLLRQRQLQPIWFARIFYLIGHLFGWITAFLPRTWARKIEQTLEFWILMRYEKYLADLKLQFSMRSMVEALQLRKLSHNEPAPDVLALLERFVEGQRVGLVRES
jgi:demethoxyubiquinone hydroxylase (CLK1/Coq7/Cat5 family)